MGNLGDSSALHLAGFLQGKAEDKRALSVLNIILGFGFDAWEAQAYSSS